MRPRRPSIHPHRGLWHDHHHRRRRQPRLEARRRCTRRGEGAHLLNTRELERRPIALRNTTAAHRFARSVGGVPLAAERQHKWDRPACPPTALRPIHACVDPAAHAAGRGHGLCAWRPACSRRTRCMAWPTSLPSRFGRFGRTTFARNSRWPWAAMTCQRRGEPGGVEDSGRQLDIAPFYGPEQPSPHARDLERFVASFCVQRRRVVSGLRQLLSSLTTRFVSELLIEEAESVEFLGGSFGRRGRGRRSTRRRSRPRWR